MVALKNARSRFTQEFVDEVTKYGASHGVSSAAQIYSCNPASVRRWVEHRNKTGQNYFLKKRGRPLLVSHTETEMIKSAINGLRAKPNCRVVTSVTVASVARGIFRKTGKGPLLESESNNGPVKFSRSWAKSFLRNKKLRFSAQTTDRTVSNEEICAASWTLFQQIESSGAPMQLWYNTDEFMQNVSPSGNSTWICPTEGTTVAIATIKLNCTCAITTALWNGVKDCQVIWKGKTDRVHVKLSHCDNPLLWQTHQPNSHFQNAETFSQLLQRFIAIVDQDRRRFKLMTRTALWFLDEASQHVPAPQDQVALDSNKILIIKIPAKTTHIFQPADQYIIPTLKKKIKKAYQASFEDYFAQNEISDAVKKACSNSVPNQRVRLLNSIHVALSTMSAEVVNKSWLKTGIVPQTEGVVGHCSTNLSQSLELCAQSECECGCITPHICPICGSNVCTKCGKDHVRFCTDE